MSTLDHLKIINSILVWPIYYTFFHGDTTHDIINKINYISSQHIILNEIQKTIIKKTYISGI